MLILFDDMVQVQRLSGGQRQTAGGIILSEEEKKHSLKGRIIAMGPGKLFVAEANTKDRAFLPLRATAESGPFQDAIAVGDVVLFAAYAGSDYQENGVDYLIMSASDIRGKIVEGKK